MQEIRRITSSLKTGLAGIARSLGYAVFGLALIAGVAFAEQRSSGDPKQQDSFEVKNSAAAKMGYLLFLPQGYETSQRKWPLLLFLHGAGECGTNLNLLKRNGPTKYVLSHPEFPFILVAPQTKGGWDFRSVMALLNETVGSYRVETSQIYLTGLSMGGSGTWSVAAAHPERFAAIVPVSGVGDPAMASKFMALPTWVFHGAQDPVISVEWSRKMVAAIKAAGGTVKYTEYPKAKHNVWARTYNNPELYSWLLAQKRRIP
jgi:predicted peptidase